MLVLSKLEKNKQNQWSNNSGQIQAFPKTHNNKTIIHKPIPKYDRITRLIEDLVQSETESNFYLTQQKVCTRTYCTSAGFMISNLYQKGKKSHANFLDQPKLNKQDNFQLRSVFRHVKFRHIHTFGGQVKFIVTHIIRTHKLRKTYLLIPFIFSSLNFAINRLPSATTHI